MTRAVVAYIVGVLLVASGAAAVFWPAGLIVAGAGCLWAAYDLVDVED